MSDVTIARRDHEDRGEYRARVAGHDEIGKLTYRKQDGGKVLAADHTWVPPQLRGHGLAARLVDAIVADARAEGFRIKPECSYVVAAFQRHPEWEDLRA